MNTKTKLRKQLKICVSGFRVRWLLREQASSADVIHQHQVVNQRVHLRKQHGAATAPNTEAEVEITEIRSTTGDWLVAKSNYRSRESDRFERYQYDVVMDVARAK